MKDKLNKLVGRKVLLVVGCLLSSNLYGQEISKVETMVNQWLGLERQINALESEWQQQQPLLTQRMRLLELEKEQLLTMLSEKKGDSSQVEKQRLALAEEQTTLEQEQGVLEQQISLLSNQLNALEQRLPPPVKQAWQQDIGDTDSSSESSIPLQANLARLSKLAEFDQRIAVVQMPINNKQNEQILVKQLYLGASSAWFVSLDGSYSGTGQVTDNGWQWQFDDNSDSSAISKAIAIFEKQSEADFVSLPFSISSLKEQ
ncbi:MAG: DUF3450 family protein [Aliiglaciecola sp.]|uniref:DUF3450 family protein n=1 Tax=Aliiglaciecola sp. TaxID=1872441 RepID=UPI0032989AD8